MLLVRAIEYGNERESPQKIDQALQMGASINGNGRYEWHPLVIAARSNQPWAISTLMMRGADIPPTPADGVDLLMEACRDGHVEMAEALINIAQIFVGYKDKNKKTALHHAVIAGEVAIVKMLIKAGADVDVSVSGLEAQEINSLFPYADSYLSDDFTPLMIAAGTGNEAMVNALLDAGANATAGDCSPLIIASRGEHHSIFEALRKHGASLASCRNASGLEGLAACVYSRMPIRFLSKLIDEHDFTDEGDDGSIHSPLGIAVSLRNIPVIELLMSAGAPLEHHEQSDEPITVWKLAFPNGATSSIYAELLTARAPAIFVPDDLDGFSKLLQTILEKCQDPPAMACFGIFTSLLSRCGDQLEALARQRQLMHPRQWVAEAAWILQRSLPQISKDRITSRPKTDSEWRSKMEQQKSAQLDALLEGSQRLIDHSMQGLAEATTVEFFFGCNKDCPESASISNFIKERILSSTGAPTPIMRLIRDAWINAARWTQDWKISSDANEDGNRFLLSLAHNLMRKGIEECGHRDEIAASCLNKLQQALPIGALMLHKFCSDPAAWLRKFENRNHLRAPDDTLASRVQIELGLPPETCEAIVGKWSDALRDARTMRWRTPADLHSVLKRQLAASIPAALLVGRGEQFTPPSATLMLLRTQDAVHPPPAPAVAARKRPAEGEAHYAPRSKEARTSGPIVVPGGESSEDSE